MISPEEIAEKVNIRVIVIENIEKMKREGNRFYPSRAVEKGNILYLYGEEYEK